MTQFARSVAATSLVMLLQTSGAFAQGLAPEDLWAHWQSEVSQAGGQLEAEVNREGNQLILTNIVLQSAQPVVEGVDPDGYVFRLEKAIFSRRADGAVEVKFPENFDVEVGELDGSDNLYFDVSAPDLAIAFLGLGDSADISATATEISVGLDKAVGFQQKPDESLEVTLEFSNVNLRYDHKITEKSFAVDTAGEIGSSYGLIVLNDAKLPQPVRLELDFGPHSWAFQAAIPEAATTVAEGGKFMPGIEVLSQQIEAGAFLNFDFGLADSSARLDGMMGLQGMAAADPAADHFEMALGGLQGKGRMDKSGLSHTLALQGLGFMLPQALFAQMGFKGEDFSVVLAAYEQSSNMTTAGDQKAQDWSYNFKLDELQASQDLWNVFDASAVLPRDPASLVLAVNGTYTLHPRKEAGFSLPEIASTSVNLTDLVVKALGANLSGSGTFAMDIAENPTFENFKMPTLDLKLHATGLYALIDNLLKIGYISDDDAYKYRMGLMKVGKVVSQPDDLESAIEIKQDQLFVNGVVLE